MTRYSHREYEYQRESLLKKADELNGLIKQCATEYRYLEGKFYQSGFFFDSIEEVKEIVRNLESFKPAGGNVGELAMFRHASGDMNNAKILLEIYDQHADEYKDIYPDALAETLEHVVKYVNRAVDKVNTANVVFNNFDHFAEVSNRCITPINSLAETFKDNMQLVIGVSESNNCEFSS